jgi:hypothetical protein
MLFKVIHAGPDDVVGSVDIRTVILRVFEGENALIAGIVE